MVAVASMSTIHPTNSCFDDALEMLEARIRKEPELARSSLLVLVHAICLIPEDHPEAGHRFAHCWLEEGGANAWQAGFLDGERVVYLMNARELELELRVEKAWRYTPREVWEHNRRTETYGPWEPELQALCGRKTDAH